MRAFSPRLIVIAASLSLIVIFYAAWRSHPAHQLAPFALPDTSSETPAVKQTALYSSRFVSSGLKDFVHSSSVTALPGGDLMAVWFAGSREGAADVEIRTAQFDAQSGEWGAEHVLATRASTSAGTQRHIRKLGNPVIALAPDKRLWMFFVSVSVGGWAGSAINVMDSADLGKTWSAPRQLITSPFFNISTLVRAAPIFHKDGSIGLPVYHEFLGKFAEYLYLSPEGNVVDKFRISRGNHSLQPTIVPLDEQRAVAMLRYAGETHHRVLASRTEDAGQTWSAPYPLAPANPNSSLAAVGLSGDRLLVALNDLQEGRFKLSLYETDARLSHWRTVVELDQSPDPLGQPFTLDAYKIIIAEAFQASSGAQRSALQQQFLSNLDYRVCKPQGCDFEYEYPYFSRSADGIYHLVYSWNNTFIKHVSFNEAWLAERL